MEGLTVGSSTLVFKPRLPPTALVQRNIKVTADSGAASSLLVLQAMLPYLVFAANDNNDPITLEISGGSNVSWSLSFEYFDQVLMPTLEERFGICIERRLQERGWSMGSASRGTIWFKINPVPKGQKLIYNKPKTYSYPDSYEVKTVDVSIVVPVQYHAKVQQEIVKSLAVLYPDVDVQFKLLQDSRQNSRWSILLVAHSLDGIRWGKDVLCSMPKNVKSADAFIKKLTNSLCNELHGEIILGSQVDEYLQDQVIYFQALCDGVSSFPRADVPPATSYSEPLVDTMGKLSINGEYLRKERTDVPFGHGSMHTQTARWVVSELVPRAEFYNKGNFVKGVGFSL